VGTDSHLFTPDYRFRHTAWSFIWRLVGCGTASESWRYRHHVCLYGLEDLHRLTHRPELIANKFWPAHDYGAVECWLEWLYNRTHQLGSDGEWIGGELDEQLYTKLPQVRFNRLNEGQREAVRQGRVEFDCSRPIANITKNAV